MSALKFWDFADVIHYFDLEFYWFGVTKGLFKSQVVYLESKIYAVAGLALYSFYILLPSTATR
jgi:hypothetical protein